jgi:hypothetical protein
MVPAPILALRPSASSRVYTREPAAARTRRVSHENDAELGRRASASSSVHTPRGSHAKARADGRSASTRRARRDRDFALGATVAGVRANDEACADRGRRGTGCFDAAPSRAPTSKARRASAARPAKNKTIGRVSAQAPEATRRGKRRSRAELDEVEHARVALERAGERGLANVDATFGHRGRRVSTGAAREQRQPK